MTDKTFKLNNGQLMPAVGFGTWKAEPGKVKEAVVHALKSGYRLIDCAYCYGNEDEVGEGLKEAFASGIKREDVMIMTKAWATYNTRLELALEKSLKSLGLEYIDMFLIHWPVLANPEGNDDKFPTNPDGSRDMIRDWNHVDAWKQMETLVSGGKVKGIGVCNYSKSYLEQLLPEAKIVPAINQIENHPSLPQQEIVDLCKEKGIHVVSYSPLGSTGGPLLTADLVVKIAEKNGVSASTVLLSYHYARGATVLAKSTTPSRIEENLKIVELSKEDLKALTDYSDELTKNGKLERYVYPPWGVNFGFPDKQ
jgi:diketogulonate reductase-like aldo/keto reductase